MKVRFDGEAGTYWYNHEEGYILVLDKDGVACRTYWQPEQIRNRNDRAESIHHWFRDRYDE